MFPGKKRAGWGRHPRRPADGRCPRPTPPAASAGRGAPHRPPVPAQGFLLAPTLLEGARGSAPGPGPGRGLPTGGGPVAEGTQSYSWVRLLFVGGRDPRGPCQAGRATACYNNGALCPALGVVPESHLPGHREQELSREGRASQERTVGGHGPTSPRGPLGLKVVLDGHRGLGDACGPVSVPGWPGTSRTNSPPAPVFPSPTQSR